MTKPTKRLFSFEFELNTVQRSEARESKAALVSELWPSRLSIGLKFLDVAGLPWSTFFYDQSRLQGPDPRESLKAAVTEIFEKNHGRYGHGRILRYCSSKCGRWPRRRY